MTTVEENGPGSAIDRKIGDCGIYEHGQRRPGRVPYQQAFESARACDGFVWIGLQQATAAEVSEVAAEFRLPPLAVEDAILAHQRPKLEVYGEVVFAVLKPVRYVDHDEIVEISELAIFVGRNFVVTVRHGESDVLRHVRAELDAGSDLLVHGPTAVLYRAADLVVDGYEHALVSIDEDVDEIENQVFGGDNNDHAQRIYKLKREVARIPPRGGAARRLPLERLTRGGTRPAS